MHKKIWKKLLSVTAAATLALGLFNMPGISAVAASSFQKDDFSGDAGKWITYGSAVEDHRIEDGFFYPARVKTALTSAGLGNEIVYSRPTAMSHGAIGKLRFKFQPGADFSGGTPIGFLLYADNNDGLPGAGLGFNLRKGSSGGLPTLQYNRGLSNMPTPEGSAYGGSGNVHITFADADTFAAAMEKWYTVELSYSCTDNADNTSIVCTITLKDENGQDLVMADGTKVGAIGLQMNKLPLGARPTSFSISGVPAASNTRIDDFEIVEQEEDQVTPEEEAAAFRTAHAQVLALKPDSVSSSHAGIIGAALTAYSSLSDEAKALLSAEKALLDSLVDALSEAQPPFDGDDFSDALKGKWVTYGDVTAQHTIADGVFHPATAAAAHKAYTRPTAMAHGALHQVSFRWKPGTAFSGSTPISFLTYADTDDGMPSTGMGFYFTKTSDKTIDPKGLPALRYGRGLPSIPAPDGVKVSGNGGVTAQPYESQEAFTAAMDEWYTITLDYEYTDTATSTTILCYVSIADKDGNNLKQVGGQYEMGGKGLFWKMENLPLGSRATSFAISNGVTGSNSLIDDLKLTQDAEVSTPEAEAEKFKALYADILAKAEDAAFSAAEMEKLGKAIDMYFTLSAEVQDILTEDGTLAKLKAFAENNADSDTASQTFLKSYEELWGLTESTVTTAYKEKVAAALTDFDKLPALSKMLLADEKALLDVLKKAIDNYVEPRPDGDNTSPFTEDFESNLNKWEIDQPQPAGANQKAQFEIVEDPDNPGNKVLKYVANDSFLVPRDVIWPKKGAMTTVTFKMRWQDDGKGQPNSKYKIISSYVDMDNWRGVALGERYTDGKQRMMAVGMQDGAAADGRWQEWYPTFTTGSWYNVTIEYSDTKAIYTLEDKDGVVWAGESPIDYQNGRLAFGTPAGSFNGVMYPAYIDDITVNFQEKDWDNDEEIDEILTYYTGNVFVKPGELAFIEGEKLGSNVSDVYIKRVAPVADPTAGLQYLSTQSYRNPGVAGGVQLDIPDSEMEKLKIVQQTDVSVKFQIPETIGVGVYVIKMKSAKGGADKYVYLNDPSVSYTVGSEGEETQAGKTFRIIGENLVPTGKKTDVRVMLEKDGVFTPLEITNIYGDDEGEKLDMYSLEARIPADMAMGEYKLYVHNGYGDNTAWSQPTTIKVGASYKADWPKTEFNVKDYGAVGDGAANDTPALVQALEAAALNGGGIVYVPTGIYKLSYSIAIPEKVELKGDGKGASSLVWDASMWPYGKLPDGLVYFTRDMEIHDITLMGSRYKTMIRAYNAAGDETAFSIYNVDMRYYPYGGGPTSGAGSSTGEMTPVEQAQAISNELSNSQYLNFQTGFNRDETYEFVRIENVEIKSDILNFANGSRGLTGGVDYMYMSNVKFNQGYSVIHNFKGSIVEGCEFYDNSPIGMDGHLYLARNIFRDNMENNRELYTMDGGSYYSDVVLQQTDDPLKFRVTSAALSKVLGMEIFVTAGQGLGQARIITGVEENADGYFITVDKPFIMAPNRNSRCTVHTVRSQTYFINGKYDNGSASGTYGTATDMIWDGNEFIRHGGQTFTLLNSHNWYLSIINQTVKEPLFLHGDGVTTTDKLINGYWRFNFNGNTAKAQSVLGFTIRGNKLYDGSRMNFTWSGNCARDIVVENNYVGPGVDEAISTPLTSAGSNDGVIFKGNTFETKLPYTAGFQTLLTPNTTLNKYGTDRFLDVDLPEATSTLKGDVNLDGVVNLKDCTLLRYYLLEREGVTLTAQQLANAEMDGRPGVDLRDCTAIRKSLIG